MEYVKLSEVLAIMARRSYAFQDFGGFDDVKQDIESLPRIDYCPEEGEKDEGKMD